jgi:uncharacterized OB-fold protein
MILPEPSPETAPFWAAVAEHRLLLRYCPLCGIWLHPQMTLCSCGSQSLEWREASGYARLVSYTVVRRTPFSEQVGVPYTLLLVRLREGPQLISSVPGDAHEWYCGMPLMVVFDDTIAGENRWTLPRFRASADTDQSIFLDS